MLQKRNTHHLEMNYDEKMAKIRFEGFSELGDLEKKCFLLLRHIDQQDLAMSTMTNILNKLESALNEESDLRRDSDDQRKILVIEINELRRKVGMNPRQLVETIQVEDEEEEGLKSKEFENITSDDPIILRRALEITRHDLSEARKRLTILEADYADVVPRRDFEALKLQLEEKNVIEYGEVPWACQCDAPTSDEEENEDEVSAIVKAPPKSKANKKKNNSKKDKKKKKKAK